MTSDLFDFEIRGRRINYASVLDLRHRCKGVPTKGASLAAIVIALIGTPVRAGNDLTVPPISRSVVVDAPVAEVWEAWTTSKGIPTFMGLDAEVDPRPRGAFRVLFDRKGTTPIGRGNDGQILALEPMKMLAITWMTPMFMPELTGQSTAIDLRFAPLCDGRKTRVDLTNSGYGSGPKWREAYAYNSKGWVTVLSRLAYRFKYGPIDWSTFAQDSKDRMKSIDTPIDRSSESIAETDAKYCR